MPNPALRHAAQAHRDDRVFGAKALNKLRHTRAIVSDLRTHGPGLFSRFNAEQDGRL